MGTPDFTLNSFLKENYILMFFPLFSWYLPKYLFIMAECINFFYHHICHFCKIKSASNKTCSCCKLVSYCSRIHQRRDWKDHKPLCLSVQWYMKQVNDANIFRLSTKNENEWKRNRISAMCTIELKLQRPLKIWEKQMFLFPNVCPVCYILNPGREYGCEHCNYTTYCSLEHKFLHLENHKKECLPLKLCYEIDKFCFELKLSPYPFEAPNFGGDTILETIDSFLTKYANSFDNNSNIVLSEQLSGALSLLYAINYFDYMRGKNELVVHIIGASDYEQSVIMSVELLFHWFMCLNKLKLVLIGPEVCEKYLEPLLCEQCSKKKIFTLGTEKKLYHQYAESSDFTVPHVIFSFNCGFSEFINTENDTWQESIRSSWGLNCNLLVFTSYTESEAELDLSAVMMTKPKGRDSTESKVFAFQNPFKSLRPYRNWESEENAVFYNNYYITIMETGTSK